MHHDRVNFLSPRTQGNFSSPSRAKEGENGSRFSPTLLHDQSGSSDELSDVSSASGEKESVPKKKSRGRRGRGKGKSQQRTTTTLDPPHNNPFFSFSANIPSDAEIKAKAKKAERAKKKAENELKERTEKENVEKGAGDLSSDNPLATAPTAPTVAPTNDVNSSVSCPTGLPSQMSHISSSEPAVNEPSTAVSPLPGGGAAPDSAAKPDTPNSASPVEVRPDLPKLFSSLSGDSPVDHNVDGLTPSDQISDKNENVENVEGGREGIKTHNKRNLENTDPAHSTGGWGDENSDDDSEKVEKVHSAGVPVSPTKRRIIVTEQAK